MKNTFLALTLAFLLIQCARKTSPVKDGSLNDNSKGIVPAKREFRGVWVATVENIDWPSKRTLSSEQQQQEFVKILDFHQKTGINAVLVQVRAASDAFYARSNEPWSEYLTGEQGKSPEPFYDPMRFMIEEAHNRNMEFHAWLNLNRGLQKNIKTVSKDNITLQKPEWFINYAGAKLYNFGLPQVRQYLVEIVTNIVRTYDVDGVHFDDYFYPYTIAGETLNDGQAFKMYGREFKNIGDWRRNNIDLLIKDISKAIASEKKWVKFGISPFGVWRNAATDSQGSATEAGQTSYDNLYADTRKWVKAGWLDYVAPQVYFAFEHSKVPYKPLVDWWVQNHGNRNLYIGHSAYKVDEASAEKAWRDPSQISKQLRYNYATNEITGSVFFSSKSLINNNLGITDTLKEMYHYPALQPLMLWKDKVAPKNPEGLEVSRLENMGATITWKLPFKNTKETDDIQSFVVYRFDENEKINLEDPRKIKAIIRNSGALRFVDKDALKRKNYLYLVTALDRLQNESAPSNQFFLK